LVDAVHIRLQGSGTAARGNLQVGLGARPQPVHPHALVHVDRRRAEQLGELASGSTTHQVHLEVALLRMHQTQRLHRIGLGSGLDGDHAQCVTGDAHRRRQAGHGLFAFQAGQAATQQPPHHENRRQRQYQHSPDQPLQPMPHPARPPVGVVRL
jgi:hypothetical protein